MLSGGAGPPLFEIQLHAPDVRRGVGSWFVGVRELIGLAVVGSSLLAWVAWGVGVTPRVARSLWASRAYDAALERRSQLGERLAGAVAELERLEERSTAVRRRVEKVHLAYGLTLEDRAGQGGFPLESTASDVGAESIHSAAVEDATDLATRVHEQLRVIDVFVTEVQAYERAHREQVRTIPSISPLARSEFVLTSPFGTRRNPFTRSVDFHSGVDLAALPGTSIRAPGGGVVVFAGRVDLRRSASWWRYGNLVALRHGDRFVTLYGHCREVKVRRGEEVERGDVIASVGNSGWSTNPHLHFEVRRRVAGGDYRPVDPRIYILDQEWSDDERVLVRARAAPTSEDYEPLPPLVGR